MFHAADVARLRALVENHLQVTLPDSLTITQAKGLAVHFIDGQVSLAAEDRNALTRGMFLLGCAIAEEKTTLHLTQERHMSSCGAMLDCSRNAVPTVAAAKRLIDRLAMLGLNLLLLYTEDTYEVPSRPYLGYLRGRFTQAELRELDDYAASYDMELMPCIQTLGHMEQFLQWNANASLRDKPDILLADDDDVYQFLREAIGAMRQCLRSKRIHIGMDEAHDVGLGRYRELHGSQDRIGILRRHLERVVDICHENDFQPIMWSDMFFRLASPTGNYLDPTAVLPDNVVASLPAADMCYWDYYNTDESAYDRLLTQHERMGRTVFGGGIWTWAGFLPHIKKTAATMGPALRACAKHRVDTVFATMWGDDGAETNAFLALNQLPIFSESCWQGPDAAPAEIARLGEKLTGIPHAAFQAFEEFYPSERDERTGKDFIWADPLYPLTNLGIEEPDQAIGRYAAAEQVLSQYDMLETRYALQLFRTARAKAELIRDLRPSYLANDRAYLDRAANELLPELISLYTQLLSLHRSLWERDMRRNGWELLCQRYGGQLARLADVQNELQRYLSGKLSTLVELDEEPLPAGRIWGQLARYAAFPGVNV